MHFWATLYSLITAGKQKVNSISKGLLLLLSRIKHDIVSTSVQVAAVSSRVDTVSSQVQTIQSQITALSSRRSITRCRLCFQEIEGSSQCQGSRHTCSGWSNSPSWTAPFRDDTDGREGGCTYRWRLECA